jgi:DNA-binding NarL/FixJ family response regulator
MANQKFLSKGVAGFFSENINSFTKEEAKLSDREREVLQLIAEGHSSKEIGEMLFLSSKTVDAHRKNIMDKLDLHTIPELTKYAVKNGLTSLDD